MRIEGISSLKKIEKQEKIGEKEKSLQLYSQMPNHILHYKYGQRKRERKKKGGRKDIFRKQTL